MRVARCKPKIRQHCVQSNLILEVLEPLTRMQPNTKTPCWSFRGPLRSCPGHQEPFSERKKLLEAFVLDQGNRSYPALTQSLNAILSLCWSKVLLQHFGAASLSPFFSCGQSLQVETRTNNRATR